MITYRILAQSFTTTQRIAKTVKVIDGTTEHDILRQVSPDLEDAGFYRVDVRILPLCTR
jgi:hypothetical protein